MGCFFTKPQRSITKPFLPPKTAEPKSVVDLPVSSEQEYTGKCKTCDKDYSRKFPTDFCSKVCKETYVTKVVIKSCSKCGKTFEVSGSEDYKTMCGRSECLDYTKTEAIKETLGKKGYSSKGILWLNKIMAKEGISIQHAENGGEFKVQFGKYTFSFDGYCAATKTVYEFYGTYYHGDPIVLAEKMDQISPNGKDTYQRLYDKTKWREREILKAGYKLVTIWEREFDALHNE